LNESTINDTSHINYANKLFGHCGSEVLKSTEEIHDIKMSRSFEIREDCAITKAKQKNMSKLWPGNSKVAGEILYIDKSSIKERSFGGAKYWTLIINDHTICCWSFVLNNKSNLKGKVRSLLSELKLKVVGINIKLIQCDDNREKKSMMEDSGNKAFGIKFEFSGPAKLKRKCNVERKSQTFFGRICFMLIGVGLVDN
jgi:hypothetical protein